MQYMYAYILYMKTSGTLSGQGNPGFDFSRGKTLSKGSGVWGEAWEMCLGSLKLWLLLGFFKRFTLLCDSIRFLEGSEVAVEIDAEKRMLHPRIHSAGHLLDSALLCLGMNDLEPSKVRVHTVCVSIAIMPVASLLILPDVCQTLYIIITKGQ